jgi:hypothetical protein
MDTVAKRCAAGALICWAVLALGPSVLGPQVSFGQAPFPLNPNPMIAPGVSLQQYAYNTAVLGRAYRSIPPYMLGYNPYPLSVNYGPGYNPRFAQPAIYNPYSPSLVGPVIPAGVPYAGGGGYTPSGGGYGPYYGGNAYSGGGGGYTAGGVDPLTGLGGGAGGYYGGYNPDPYGLYGTAATFGAYGQLGMDMEKARILREQAEQAKLDTRKKLVDTLAYIRQNEYTFTQAQADIAKKILDRVQKMPTKEEVISGRSLNIMLDSLITLSALKVDRLPTVTLDEDVLKLLNVTGQLKSDGSVNIGLLRDNGRFAWPSVFDEKNVASEKEKKDIELHAQELYQQSINAKIDKNTLKDLRTGLQHLRESLNKNINQVPMQGYTEGLRFLNSFDAAVLALERGDAPLNLDFQQKFAKGGKTVQELVDYMKRNGLQFTPASPGEERAYTAVQAALAANSLIVSSQVTTGKN